MLLSLLAFVYLVKLPIRKDLQILAIRKMKPTIPYLQSYVISVTRGLSYKGFTV